MLVREVMSSPVATVSSVASLSVAIDRMLEHDVGSLVTVDGESGNPTPSGILTATDVLHLMAAEDRPASELDVSAAASSPLETVEPDRTVGHAVERMLDAGIKHLPVVDGLDVVGMVTLTDVALHYEAVREEAIELEGARRLWTGEE